MTRLLSNQVSPRVPLRPRGGLGADDVPGGAGGALPLPGLAAGQLAAAAVHREGARLGLRGQHVEGAGGGRARAAHQEEEGLRWDCQMIFRGTRREQVNLKMIYLQWLVSGRSGTSF